MVEKVETFVTDMWQIFVVFIGQLVAGVWWVSRLSSRVAQNEKNIETILRDSATRSAAVAGINDRLIRQETILDRIERKLDRIAP